MSDDQYLIDRARRVIEGNMKLKSEANRAALAREHPERFEWWVRMEQIARGTFRPAEPYADLAEFVSTQGD